MWPPERNAGCNPTPHLDPQLPWASNTLMWLDISIVVAAYLAGSISSAVVVCRALGFSDPRTVGSQNPGATNVLRHFGKRAAALTLAGDLTKGLLPVLVGRMLEVSTPALAAAGLAAFLGHLFPIFFGFRGGKGVATFVGVLFAFAWPLGLAFAAVWLAMAVLFRYASLAALTAAFVNPGIGAYLQYPRPVLAAVASMVVFIFWRHRTNIRDLITGAENKIGPRDPS